MKQELKEIKGFEGKYAITTDGRVWSYHSKKFLKLIILFCFRMFIEINLNSKNTTML